MIALVIVLLAVAVTVPDEWIPFLIPGGIVLFVIYHYSSRRRGQPPNTTHNGK